MRRYVPLILASAWSLAPAVGPAQTSSPERALADFYWRGGHHQAALFYVQLQEKPEKKGPPKELPKQSTTLEQHIAEALKTNPDIRIADARVREAEAELARTRLKAVSDLTLLHAEIAAAQASLEEGKIRYEGSLKLMDAKVIGRDELNIAKYAVQKLTADLAAKQAKLPYLLGQPSDGKVSTGLNILGLAVSPDGRHLAVSAPIDYLIRKKYLEAKTNTKISDEEFLRRLMLDTHNRVPTAEEMKKYLKVDDKDRRAKWVDQMLEGKLNLRIDVTGDKPGGFERAFAQTYWDLYFHTQAPDSPLTDKLRKALDAKMRMDVDKVSVKDALEYLREKAMPGINFHVRAKALKKDLIDIKLTEPVPIGAVLQYLEDEYGIVFVLRDYGIVVVAVDERLPPGAIRVVDFWKHGGKTPVLEPKEKDKPGPDVKPKPLPNESSRGLIEKVDPKDPWLVQISVGADAGLTKGQILDAFRLQPEPRFLGRIEIVEVQSSKSIGRVTRTSLNAALMPRAGDHVGSLTAAK